jgi:hypothetical protein
MMINVLGTLVDLYHHFVYLGVYIFYLDITQRLQLPPGHRYLKSQQQSDGVESREHTEPNVR